MTDDDEGEEADVRLRPHGVRALVAGPSGSGKSTAAAALLERLTEKDYQICLIDPEGDYETGIGASSVVVGDADVAPSVQEVLGVVERAGRSVVVNLLALPIPDRPPFFDDLVGQLAALSTKLGRPEWLVIDEAHHLLPRARESEAVGLLEQFGSVLMVTVHPEAVDAAVLGRLTTVIAVGGSPREIMTPVAESVEGDVPDFPDEELASGRLALWDRWEDRLKIVDLEPPKAERTRHRRKYALGTMLPEKSFWFRGPDEKLNLRAHDTRSSCRWRTGSTTRRSSTPAAARLLALDRPGHRRRRPRRRGGADRGGVRGRRRCCAGAAAGRRPRRVHAGRRAGDVRPLAGVRQE